MYATHQPTKHTNLESAMQYLVFDLSINGNHCKSINQ